MQRIPGGLMLIPLILGSLIGTFAPGTLEIGSFTTALFSDGALPLIALLIFATGTQVDIRSGAAGVARHTVVVRSEEHTSELQSLMRISYAVFCLQKKKL